MNDVFAKKIEKRLDDIISEISFGEAVKTIPLDELILTGIYFLISDSEVVYIGQSLNIYQRINRHLSDNKKIFDEVKFIEYEKEFLNDRESEYINLFIPKYNKTKTDGFYGCFVDIVKNIKINNANEVAKSKLTIRRHR